MGRGCRSVELEVEQLFGRFFTKLWSPAPPRIEGRATPPPLPFRCGTILLDLEPDKRRAIFERWRQAEAEYVAWVAAHPDPDPEWVEEAERLKAQHAQEGG